MFAQTLGRCGWGFSERAEKPALLLLSSGDLIQNIPLERKHLDGRILHNSNASFEWLRFALDMRWSRRVNPSHFPHFLVDAA